LINSITAPTGEGLLFEVDMRLRPSGSQGPVATSLSSFRDYQKTSAWTWEKLALTRARVVSGDADLAQAISQAITASLCAELDAAIARKDVLDMRRLMVKEQGSAGLWDIKRARGGLVEVEFIAQFLQLIHAARHPEILDTNTHAALGRLAAAGFLEAGIAGELREACLLYHRITQVLRLCVTGAFDPATSPAGLNQLVARAAGVPDIRAAHSLVNDTQIRIAGLFDELIGPVG
jgi:glutamate-ammonia-ligase adenylyltransferase